MVWRGVPINISARPSLNVEQHQHVQKHQPVGQKGDFISRHVYLRMNLWTCNCKSWYRQCSALGRRHLPSEGREQEDKLKGDGGGETMVKNAVLSLELSRSSFNGIISEQELLLMQPRRLIFEEAGKRRHEQEIEHPPANVCCNETLPVSFA